MASSWAEIIIEVSAEMGDAVTNRLMEDGAQGVIVDDSETPGPADENGFLVVLKAYFSPDRLPALQPALVGYLEEIRAFFPSAAAPRLRVGTLEGEDWAHAWKRYFKPFLVAPGVVVKPSWETYEPGAGELVIELDPGMAFGTGQHATTRLCMAAIQKIVAEKSDICSALDLGTGSGILAILLAKRGVERVLAVDVDPEAVEAAAENTARNGAAAVETKVGGVEQITETFDLVVANILAEVLIHMRAALAERLREGGIMVLSGILNEKAAAVRDAFSETGMACTAEERDGEWTALVFAKRKGI